MPNQIDTSYKFSGQSLVGKRFGFLTVISYYGVVHYKKNGQRSPYWNCLCDCGEMCIRASEGIKNKTKSSCGCQMGKHRISHGHAEGGRSLEYRSWTSMRQRCNNPKTTGYENYGGRGIKVCERWNNSFEAFLYDMGLRPSQKHTIERIDNEKGYGPDNCKWATWSEQMRNRRNNVFLILNGKKICAKDISKQTGISEHRVCRMIKNKVPMEHYFK